MHTACSAFPLPLVPCLLVIARRGLAQYRAELALSGQPPPRRERRARRCSPSTSCSSPALLYLTGGLENPFAMLFLAPVMISAAALPPMRTLGLGLLAIAAATLLAFVHQPLPWEPGEALSLSAHLPGRHLVRHPARARLHRRLCLARDGGGAPARPGAGRDGARAGARAAPVAARRPGGGRGPRARHAAGHHRAGQPSELQRLGRQEGPIAEDITLLRRAGRPLPRHPRASSPRWATAAAARCTR